MSGFDQKKKLKEKKKKKVATFSILFFNHTMAEQEIAHLNVDYDHLESVLCNTPGNVSLAERFRALFTLKNLPTERSIEIISKGTHIDWRPEEECQLVSYMGIK